MKERSNNMVLESSEKMRSNILDHIKKLKQCTTKTDHADVVCISIDTSAGLDLRLVQDICQKHLDLSSKNGTSRRYWLSEEIREQDNTSNTRQPHNSKHPLRMKLCVHCFMAYFGT